MSDELDVNPAAPDAAPAPIAAAPAAPAFETTQLHADLVAHIEAFGGYAAARLHQLLGEMRELFKV